jgi:DNA-directed RNA polymerase III subunit RPC3
MQVDAVVRERFGGPACRIFRLLLLKRQLEQKQIAEMAMIPVKDTRELLYKLVKVEFVQLQEVARTADHSPSRTFYLWRVRAPHTNWRCTARVPRRGRA